MLAGGVTSAEDSYVGQELVPHDSRELENSASRAPMGCPRSADNIRSRWEATSFSSVAEEETRGKRDKGWGTRALPTVDHLWLAKAKTNKITVAVLYMRRPEGTMHSTGLLCTDSIVLDSTNHVVDNGGYLQGD